MYYLQFVSCLIVLTVAFTSPAKADEAAITVPKWELGLAVGAASLPQYMGSNERYTFAAPLPYFIYRGERIRMDRGGLTAALFDIAGLSLDLSLGAGLPVRNSNSARTGMPSLKFNLQAGPRLNWSVFQNQQSSVNLRLPVRGAIDTAGSMLGWLSEPEIQIRHEVNPDFNVEFTTGLLFASKKYHSTYYDVAPAFVTPTRAAYRASGGLHSVSLTAKLVYQYSDHIRLFSAIRYRNLKPGAISNSPLVKDSNYFSIMVGMAWSIFQSETLSRVSKDD